MLNELILSTDIEADGPIPGDYSMLSLATVAVLPGGVELHHFQANLERLPFAGQDPGTMRWWSENQGAYEKTRMDVRDPKEAMDEYAKWLSNLAEEYHLVFAGYPVTFDFMFVYWYIMHFHGSCPFGFSGLDMKTMAMTILGTPFRGTVKKNMPKAWFDKGKPHTHDPLDDAREQALMYARMRSTPSIT